MQSVAFLYLTGLPQECRVDEEKSLFLIGRNPRLVVEVICNNQRGLRRQQTQNNTSTKPGVPSMKSKKEHKDY